MKYVACIAEGSAETAIIDILVDHHLLIFEREEMLDEKVFWRVRCSLLDICWTGDATIIPPWGYRTLVPST
ncbi:MAG: hypothetical protein IJ188_00380 [Clostridia bacterium]|nr:hypothetical protein [Clostridia bacterium]